MLQIFTCIFFFFCYSFTMAQEKKVEVEKRIPQNKMPDESIKLIEPFLEDAKMIRFYLESGGGEISYEAKFSWKGKKLSIEFFENGSLMDIEQLIQLQEIKTGVREEITEFLSENYAKYRITRIQRQFSAEEPDEEGSEVIEEFMENDWDDLTIRYEIVAEVLNEDVIGPYEFLFDRKGKLIEKRKIIRRSSDNILY